MWFKSGFVRCLFLSLMVLFVGCAELKSLREERVVMNQRIEELQSERDDLDSRYNLSEQEKAELIEERDRLENARRSMEERLGVGPRITLSAVIRSSIACRQVLARGIAAANLSSSGALSDRSTNMSQTQQR